MELVRIMEVSSGPDALSKGTLGSRVFLKNEELGKARHHKYVKRELVSVNPKRYRYWYRSPKGGLVTSASLHEGTSFRHGKGEEAGHYHIEETHKDDAGNVTHVTIRHDERGDKKKVSVAELRELVHGGEHDEKWAHANRDEILRNYLERFQQALLHGSDYHKVSREGELREVLANYFPEKDANAEIEKLKPKPEPEPLNEPLPEGFGDLKVGEAPHYLWRPLEKAEKGRYILSQKFGPYYVEYDPKFPESSRFGIFLTSTEAEAKSKANHSTLSSAIKEADRKYKLLIDSGKKPAPPPEWMLKEKSEMLDKVRAGEELEPWEMTERAFLFSKGIKAGGPLGGVLNEKGRAIVAQEYGHTVEARNALSRLRNATGGRSVSELQKDFGQDALDALEKEELISIKDGNAKITPIGHKIMKAWEQREAKYVLDFAKVPHASRVLEAVKDGKNVPGHVLWDHVGYNQAIQKALDKLLEEKGDWRDSLGLPKKKKEEKPPEKEEKQEKVVVPSVPVSSSEIVAVFGPQKKTQFKSDEPHKGLKAPKEGWGIDYELEVPKKMGDLPWKPNWKQIADFKKGVEWAKKAMNSADIPPDETLTELMKQGKNMTEGHKDAVLSGYVSYDNPARRLGNKFQNIARAKAGGSGHWGKNPFWFGVHELALSLVHDYSGNQHAETRKKYTDHARQVLASAWGVKAPTTTEVLSANDPSYSPGVQDDKGKASIKHNHDMIHVAWKKLDVERERLKKEMADSPQWPMKKVTQQTNKIAKIIGEQRDLEEEMRSLKEQYVEAGGNDNDLQIKKSLDGWLNEDSSVVLIKAGFHKYVKKEVIGPNKYKYWYRTPSGELVSHEGGHEEISHHLFPNMPPLPPSKPKATPSIPAPPQKTGANLPVNASGFKYKEEKSGGAFPGAITTHEEHPGKTFMVKPQEPLKAHAEGTGSILASMILGDKAVPAKAISLEGAPSSVKKGEKLGSVQEMVENGGTLPKSYSGVVSLPKSVQQDILAAQVANWMIGDHDAHGAQYLFTPDKKGAIRIDFGQTYKHLGKDELNHTYHPNASFSEEEPASNHLFQAYVKGKIDLDLHDPKIYDAIKRAQAIPDETVEKLVKPYAKEVEDKLGRPAEQVIKDAVDRKNNIQKDFEKFYTTMQELRHKNTGDIAEAPPPFKFGEKPVSKAVSLKSMADALENLVELFAKAQIQMNANLADKVFPGKPTVSKPVDTSKPGSVYEHYVHKWKHGEPLSTGQHIESLEQAQAIAASEIRSGGSKKGKGAKTKVKKGIRVVVKSQQYGAINF